ncbi:MAG: hypothetical protein D6713_03985 [Deltaproteobacteria bacterium]|nr:MAG: hypothetical protein D6713_03985 [Deltaproteobacteria bacterium]
MALFNYAAREISAKIVYYGPGLSGKTTNIEMIHSMLDPERRGKLISLPTETDRTLFFDFLPFELGEIKGFKVRFHLYTVPGQVFYNQTRRIVLQGVDGVVFVADSQTSMLDANLESLKNLEENLATYGKKLEEIPFVIQYNKRDLKNIMSVEELNRHLNKLNVPFFEAIAITGEGVKETLMEISRMVFNHLRRTLLAESELGEDVGDLVGAEIDEKFKQVEEEIEEIDEVEDLTGEEEISVDFSDLALDEEAGDLAGESESQEGAEEGEVSAQFEFTEEEAEGEAVEETLEDILGEIEVEEEEEEPAAAGGEEVSQPAEIGVSVDGDGLTFLRLESPYLSLDGQAIIPAVFLDREGKEVTVRIKISIEKG